MSPQWPTSDGVTKRDRFSSGWTGAVAVGLIVYIALAIALILVDGRAWPWLDVFNLYSDSVASIGVAVLTGAAARGSAEPAARRTWWLLTAAPLLHLWARQASLVSDAVPGQLGL